jgi:hypothetical protein
MSALRGLLYGVAPDGWRARAAAGGLAWVGGVCLLQPGWSPALLLLAPLVVIPLGLALLPPASETQAARLWRVAACVQLPAALLVLGVYRGAPGVVAAACAVPWLGFTLLLALLGGLRLRACRRGTAELCANIALLYLAVGGAWLVLSALDARPLTLSADIVRATAVHFHYAGFALPLLAGLTAHTLGSRPARFAAVSVLLGVPLVAAGITLSAFGLPLPEWLAAWFLAGAGVLLAVLHPALAARSRRPGVRLLLVVSSLSLLAGMSLAGLYALGNALGAGWLDIAWMVRTHGVLNAFGFALPGLLAWNLPPGTPAPRASGLSRKSPTAGAGASFLPWRWSSAT